MRPLMGLRAFFVLLAAARTTRTTASGKGKSSAGSGAQVDAVDGSPWQPSAQQLRRGVPRDDDDWFAPRHRAAYHTLWPRPLALRPRVAAAVRAASASAHP